MAVISIVTYGLLFYAFIQLNVIVHKLKLLNLPFKAFLQNIQLIQRAYYLAKTFGHYMGINLRSIAVFMARQVLYIPQIDPIFQ
jgi:uncharacterized membrane protein YbhN (UPF0104 family)